MNKNSPFSTPEWVERVVVTGLNKKTSSIQVRSKCKYNSNNMKFPKLFKSRQYFFDTICIFSAVGEASLEFEGDSVLVIRKPGVLISEDWEIEIA